MNQKSAGLLVGCDWDCGSVCNHGLYTEGEEN